MNTGTRKYAGQSVFATKRRILPSLLASRSLGALLSGAIAALPVYAADNQSTFAGAPSPMVLAQATPATSNAKMRDANSGSLANTESMEKITITASKRKERLIDTPAAISQLSAAKLENLGINSFADYASLVPNLNDVGGYAPGVGTVVIRGMYTGPQQTTNTTAFYLGEAPFSSSGAFSAGSLVTPDPDLTEVASVEVLKGPQGTLYGASSLGGLIRIVPKLPDTKEFYGTVKLGTSKVSGGGDGYTGKLSVNVPVSPGMLGIQVGAFSRQDGGFVTNTRTNHDKLAKVNSDGGSLSVLLTPTKELQVNLRALTQKTKSDGAAYQENIFGTGTPVTGERQFSNFFDPRFSSKYELLEANAQYEMGLGTFTGSLSRAKYEVALNADWTRNYGQLFSASGPYCAFFHLCAPADYNIHAEFTPDMTKETGELRFASKRLGDVEFVVGLFHTSEDSNYGTNLYGQNSSGVPVAAPFDAALISNTFGNYTESSVFGNLTYYLTNDFDLSGGMRHAANRQDYTFAGLSLTSPYSSRTVHSEENSNIYQITARYRPTQALSTYARVATGYRPGGPQNNVDAPNSTYDSDTVTNYEVGVKGSTLGGRLSYDASVYHIDWKKIQLNGLLNGKVIVGNAGKATIDGFEVQASYAAASGFSLGGSLGYNTSKIKEVGVTTAAIVGAVAGDQLPGSPKLSAAVFGDYRFALSGDAQGKLGATLRHQGERPSAFSGSPLNPKYLEPAYNTLDLRAEVQWKRYSLRLGIDNVTDENGYASYLTFKNLPSQTANSYALLTRPRTLSLTLGVDF